MQGVIGILVRDYARAMERKAQGRWEGGEKEDLDGWGI